MKERRYLVFGGGERENVHGARYIFVITSQTVCYLFKCENIK